MTVHIDLTTSNTVYNPFSAQGSWIQHRFGKRDYPDTELNLARVINYLSQIDDQVFLISSFGDSLCYSGISDLLKLNKNFIIHSYANIKDDKLFNLLGESTSTAVIKLSGIDQLADKVYLNSKWDTIKNNISILKSKCLIEFELFDHNAYQVEALLELCDKFNIKLKIVPGTSLNGVVLSGPKRGFSSVIDENKNWLYDVISLNSPFPDDFLSAADMLKFNINAPDASRLVQTTEGYQTLRTFVKGSKGKTILSHPLTFKVKNEKSQRPLKGFSLSVTGHVLPSESITKCFSNMLCTDWKVNHKDVFTGDQTNNYLLNIAKLVNQINSLDLNKIHYSNSLRSVLSYLSDSDI
jgi:hypothetical protein